MAFLGAAVNACYLIRLGTSVSHLTGDVSKVAMNAVEGHSHLSAEALHLLTAAIGFLTVAVLSGPRRTSERHIGATETAAVPA